jgi:hypothetical protein
VLSRAASPEDAEAVARIYNEGIEERIATFETSLRTAREIKAWFDGTHPVVVVEEEGEVISFANTASYSPRACYSGVAEFSVYTASDYGSGGGGRLLETRRACVRGEHAEPEATLLLRLPGGGNPRETRQARRGVARRRSRRATSSGKPVEG